jgi:hypothetical protein
VTGDLAFSHLPGGGGASRKELLVVPSLLFATPTTKLEALSTDLDQVKLRCRRISYAPTRRDSDGCFSRGLRFCTQALTRRMARDLATRDALVFLHLRQRREFRKDTNQHHEVPTSGAPNRFNFAANFFRSQHAHEDHLDPNPMAQFWHNLYQTGSFREVRLHIQQSSSRCCSCLRAASFIALRVSVK